MDIDVVLPDVVGVNLVDVFTMVSDGDLLGYQASKECLVACYRRLR